MSNLTKWIALEKLIKFINHGRAQLDFQVRAGEIVGVTVTGNKKILYNSSEKDVNTNQAALEYIIRRIAQQLESKDSSEITFRVLNMKDKIKVVEVESKQIIK